MLVSHKGTNYQLLETPRIADLYIKPCVIARAIAEDGEMYLIKWTLLKPLENGIEEDPEIADWNHPVEVTKHIGDIPFLFGIKEFADFLGWSKARLSKKLARQKEGSNVRPALPEPIQVLAATPIWTLEQALEFKERLASYETSQTLLKREGTK